MIRRFLASSLACLTLTLAEAHEVLVSEDSEQARFDLVLIQQGLRDPSSFTFIDSDVVLVTGWGGELWRVSTDGTNEAIEFAPLLTEDGGLRTVSLHPDFAHNGILYFCHANGTEQHNETQISRGRLAGDRVEKLETIFSAGNFSHEIGHQGCVFLWDSESTFLVTLGDRVHHKERAQSLEDYFGLVVRLDENGAPVRTTVNQANPAARPGIRSWGHRNVQGIAFDRARGEIWAHEHGPYGGDEINVLHEGRNYGWPVATFGIDYDKTILSETPTLEGTEPPVFYWYPSIAPSGLTIYEGDAFPKWRGDLFLGGLASRRLHRLERHEGRIIREELLLAAFDVRIRDVRTGPNGYLYVLTNEPEGRLLALMPRPAAP